MHTMHELAAQGMSLHAIARQLGLARTTVRKYVRGAAVPAARPTKPQKLDPFKDQIRRWVHEDHLLNCVTMRDRLRARLYRWRQSAQSLCPAVTPTQGWSLSCSPLRNAARRAIAI